MSGHSKWATTHRQKEANDAKRGAIFTKLAMAITIAVKQGGGVGDPDKNFKLRLAVDKARQMNMPKENIHRAIEKGMGTGAGAELIEAVFEGFTPGGVAVMVQTLTDNTARTGQQVRMILEKGGGSMGSSGAVGYLFKHYGEVQIANNGLTDADELKIIDLGIEDIEKGPGDWLIYCDKEQTFEVRETLAKMGYQVMNAELTAKPLAFIEIGETDTQAKIEAILEQLEELDDVQKVWTNYA